MNPQVQQAPGELRSTGFFPAWASAWTLIVFALAALAVLLAVLVGIRWLTLSSCVLGLALVLVGNWIRRGRPGVKDHFLWVLGGILCLAVLLVTVIAPGLLNPLWAMDLPVPKSDPREQVVVPREQEHDKGKPLGENDWADAATEGIRQDGILARIGEV